MNISINGQTRDLAPDTSLQDLVQQSAKSPALVITELNGRIIHRTAWDTTRLKADDKVELVAFVGGG